MDLIDQFKKNEEDFLKNCLDLDEDLDPEIDQEGPEDPSDHRHSLNLETRAQQRYRANTMRGVAACFKCKSATSKIRVWAGDQYYFRCTGCGERINRE